ncbi:Protein of unknown function (DUF1666) [Abeliophyllum distichum]|uniref:Uncharacterized protein n=1 Tax=Abeliophyllum distichum TaxID=126358 RepID=A0ABD1V4S7_9LAMI
MSLGSDEKRTREEESDFVVLAPDLIRIIESSILSFLQFMKMDKKKIGGILNLFGSQNQMATPLQQIQSSHEKKAMKLKELWKRTKSYKKKSWPSTQEDTEMLLGLIDSKIVSRVLLNGEDKQRASYFGAKKR